MNGESEGGRQADGRFAPGNAANPKGNPGNGKAVHFRALIASSTTDEDFMAVWRAIIDAAKGGDMKAADLFCERLMGKVPQAMEHTGADGAPLRIKIVTESEPAK